MKARTSVSLIVIVLLGLLIWQLLRTDYGVKVDSVRWLPSEAHNVTYIKVPGLNTIAEFEMAQEALEAWCISSGRPLKKLGPTEKGSVPRCLRDLEERGVIPVVPEPNDDNEWMLWYQDRYEKSLSDGDLYYEECWSNGGGYVIGYDVEDGMGYYSYAHH